MMQNRTLSVYFSMTKMEHCRNIIISKFVGIWTICINL